MLSQSSDVFTKSSDMLNKNTLGVKKCKVKKEAALLIGSYVCVTKNFDISWGEIF